MNTLTSQDYSTSKKALGRFIQEARIKASLTQEALASKAGLTRATIADIEKGSANPTFEGLSRIADALGLKVTDFFSFGVLHQSRYIVQPTNGNLYEALVAQLISVQNGELNIHVAYAKSSGVDLLTAAFRAFRSAGGRLCVLAGIDQRNTTAEALYKLMELCDELYVVHDSAFAQTYHPKIFIVSTAMQAWVAVGSNNLTRGGLCTNYETCHTQVLNFTDSLDRQSYQALIKSFTVYQESNLIKQITAVEDIRELLADGLIVTEQQSRQNSTKHINFGTNLRFGHKAVFDIPSASEKVQVPTNLFVSVDFGATSSKGGYADMANNPALAETPNESEITAASLLSLEVSPDVQSTYWFEMRMSTGGSRNILDLSSAAKLQTGTHPETKDGYIPGGVTFFGLDPKAHEVEKGITIVYNGIAYYPSTIKFTPNNASWRIQLKGDAETGSGSLSQFGRTDFANHILVFHKITSDHYILEIMSEAELDSLKKSSDFWATNGSSKTSKAFGKVGLGSHH